MTPDQQHALDSAFIISAARGYGDILHSLLKAGADIHANGDAALIRAAEEGHTDVVEYLLMRGADPQGDKTILRAAQSGQMSTVRILFNWANKQGPTNNSGPGGDAPSAPSPQP